MRFSEDKPGDLERARAAVAAWRTQNPDGTSSDMAAAIGGQFHPDYGPVLRAMLFTVDRRRAPIITGIVTAQAGAAR